MKKIVIASDSFKGSLSSGEVAMAASAFLQKRFPSAEILQVPVADGGEGTVQAVTDALGGEIVHAEVSDPLGRPVTASFGRAGSLAIVEMASASGLPLLAEEERNPLLTSCRGTGELIMHAFKCGCRQFLVGIGGSATNDGGMGMLSALGVRFYDVRGSVLEGRGCELEKVEEFDIEGLLPLAKDASFCIACDVDTVFWGLDGASETFAPQKGASPEDVLRLDAGMRHYAGVIKRKSGLDLNKVKGSGAAGGLGGAFRAFLNAKLESGVEMVLKTIDFDRLIQDADLVITGEGKADFQTARGKTAAGVMAHAKAAGVPVILIAGCVEMCPELASMGFKDILQVKPEGQPMELAIQAEIARANIADTLKRYFQ